MYPAPALVNACWMLPVSGSRRSSTPPLPTSHMSPVCEGAMPCTNALAGDWGSSACRASTEKRRQFERRYHSPLSLLANQMPPSRSSYARDHDGLTAPCEELL